MFNYILSTLKVLFRNGETIIDLIQQVITEVKGETEMKANLDEFKANNIAPGGDQ